MWAIDFAAILARLDHHILIIVAGNTEATGTGFWHRRFVAQAHTNRKVLVTQEQLNTLRPISDFLLVDETQDLRGRAVMSGDLRSGAVRDMLVDPRTRRVAALQLDDGRHIAIERIRLRGNQIHLSDI